ncbi:MAG TPA: peroxiredoxin [Candidatus Polarisedimenticolia bacterium]|nr:peroxiredoxin [Candidatus Polarisedimenticolia bacterium]
MRRDDLHSLPPGLPTPEDDGAAAHLVGHSLPPIALVSTSGRRVRLDRIGRPWAVLYCYPRTGLPDVDSPPGWDAIPGARGCTPQACAYRDHRSDLARLGAEVFGVSTQDSAYQEEMAARLHLGFEILSDAHLELATALRLPTFKYGEWTLLRRLTLIARDARIAVVFYPVFPPDADASRVVEWLRAQPV